MWEGQRHKLLQGDLPIVGGAKTQTAAGRSPHCGRGKDTNCSREISPIVGGAKTQTAAGRSHHCGRGRDTNCSREISPLWEGQRHKLQQGDLTILGGQRQKILQGVLTIVGGAETQTTAGKSPRCGRGRDTNYCREISPLWERQRHKLPQGDLPVVGGA
ncbi:unnamed protein product [Staurois parvus]|uniref:Uncharacterized protein n=1 Tax=Staurois parvus TaxID=386267 RepID=A0ABN9F2B3_9NEOB|nr:unnamed protein product [Staurois parvus]